jgi:hypothetical protein
LQVLHRVLKLLDLGLQLNHLLGNGKGMRQGKQGNGSELQNVFSHGAPY